MFPSMEVRWFYKGQVPPEIVDWFQQGEHAVEEQSPRVDYYLYLKNMDSLGIKLREGKIEIKQLHSRQGAVRFHRRVTGLVEQWRKWSLDLAVAEGTLDSILVPAGAWIGVDKARSLRKFEVSGAGQVRAVPATDFPLEGCGFELTDLQTEGKPWWSLGFEAFGNEASLRRNLLLTVELVLAGEGVPSLKAADSYGYPRWLATLGQRRG